MWLFALIPKTGAREKNKASASGNSSLFCFFGLTCLIVCLVFSLVYYLGQEQGRRTRHLQVATVPLLGCFFCFAQLVGCLFWNLLFGLVASSDTLGRSKGEEQGIDNWRQLPFLLFWSDLFDCLFGIFFGILPWAGAREKNKASASGNSSLVGLLLLFCPASWLFVLEFVVWFGR